MKKILLSLLIFSGIINVKAQTIPNSGFENWQPYSFGEYPAGWQTSDSITVVYSGGNSVKSDTMAYEGTFSIAMKSTQIIYLGFPVNGPGIATNGIMSLVGGNFVFTGGSPDTARSQFLTGFFYLRTAECNRCGANKNLLVKK